MRLRLKPQALLGFSYVNFTFYDSRHIGAGNAGRTPA
jgi:hypothetical protein